MRAAPVAHDTLEAARGPENPRVSFGVLRLVCALLGTISFGSIRFQTPLILCCIEIIGTFSERCVPLIIQKYSAAVAWFLEFFTIQ